MILPAKKSQRGIIHCVVLFCIIIVLFPGCITTFEYPLTQPGSQPLDKALFGTWTANDEDTLLIIRIGKDKNENHLLVVVTDMNEKGEIDLSILTGHTSVFKTASFMNLKWLQPKENQTRGYTLVKYAVGDRHLNLYTADSTIIENDIKNGKIKGEIEKSHEYVTEETGKLVSYILENSSRAFPTDQLLIQDLTVFKTDPPEPGKN